MVALAAPSFNQPSETFIRAHVATIAPGKTILLFEDEHGIESVGSPVISRLEWLPPPRYVAKRVLSGIRFRLRHWGDQTLSGARGATDAGLSSGLTPTSIAGGNRCSTGCRLRGTEAKCPARHGL